MNVLPASFFIKNRSKLKALLLPSSAVIITSARPMPRNGDQYYPYRQSSDMFYLTGIRQEQCTLVICPGECAGAYNEVLYIPEQDEKTTMWEGERLSAEKASEVSGIRDVRLSADVRRSLGDMLRDCMYVYFGTMDGIFPSNELEFRKEAGGLLDHLQEHDLAPLLTRLRMFKEPEELEMIVKAIEITSLAFHSVLKMIRPGMHEYEVAAVISHVFQSNGVRDHAFDPIMASGPRALVLHYNSNNAICKDGELLLMDFGAEWEYYAADISRTIPVNGRFAKRQRELYEAALRVFRQAVAGLRPGKLLRDYHEEVGRHWQEEHIRLGLYSRSDAVAVQHSLPPWKKYYWHGTSHSLGLDVHDRFDPSVPISPGMVLSCEPGIYIPEEGTGIRIETDVLITEKGPVDLAAGIPLDPAEIEALMGRG